MNDLDYTPKHKMWLAMEIKQVKRKVLLLGDGAVGKTSLIRKFVTDKFDDKYITTIGTKITKKDLRYSTQDGEMALTLMIWDILGQKGYKSIQSSSYRGAEGALIVCDLTRKETLDSMQEYWIPELQKVTGDIPMIFVGNKCDLIDQRQISEEMLAAAAGQFGSQFFVSSAKTGENVEIIFKSLGERVIGDKAAPAPVPPASQEQEITDLTGVTDRIINDFCEAFGDRETAMAMVRQQFSQAGVDVKAPEKQALLRAAERLAEVEKGFRDDFTVKSALAKRKRLIEQYG